MNVNGCDNAEDNENGLYGCQNGGSAAIHSSHSVLIAGTGSSVVAALAGYLPPPS